MCGWVRATLAACMRVECCLWSAIGLWCACLFVFASVWFAANWYCLTGRNLFNVERVGRGRNWYGGACVRVCAVAWGDAVDRSGPQQNRVAGVVVGVVVSAPSVWSEFINEKCCVRQINV